MVKIKNFEYWGAEKEDEVHNYPDNNWIPNTYPWLTFERQKERAEELEKMTGETAHSSQPAVPRKTIKTETKTSYKK